MVKHSAGMKLRGQRRRVAAAAGLAALGALIVIPAMAQSPAPLPPPTQNYVPSVPAPAPAEVYVPPPSPPQNKPGLFEAIGRFFDRGTSTFREHLTGAKQRMDDLGDQAASDTKQIEKGAAEVGKGAAEATKSAVDAVARLPTARVMRGRERCEVAPNGAPDCVAAAEALCRKHGFAGGKSMDFTSAEECPAKSYIGQGGECTTVTFISQAMCQ
jgi:hypothetical protein